MSPKRRTALASVGVAAVLVAIKLATGLASGSLGLVSEALHSGTDLVAAVLTFLAIGYAGRPADPGHQYGHGKAEHLAALAEAAVLAVVSFGVAGLAVARLAGWVEIHVDAAWWAFVAIAVVIALDLARVVASRRAAVRYGSPALMSNAVHFASDLVGTLAVLAGLICVGAGWPQGDSVAALFVAMLVLIAAARLMRQNVDVLMDTAPPASVEAARDAIGAIDLPLELLRLRLRYAAGRHFADVVISVPPGTAVGQGHATADRVEEVLRDALPGIDVVVHVEPGGGESVLRERATAAALAVPLVREVHNLAVIDIGGATEISLHLKLPGDTSLDAAHAVAEAVERGIMAAAPEVDDVHTHLEPLDEGAVGEELELVPAEIERVVLEATGAAPRSTRVVRTDDGLVVLLTLGIGGASSLADAHALASGIEERICAAVPGIVDVLVHTEP
jgi:cation diffusion facilitator family transporter